MVTVTDGRQRIASASTRSRVPGQSVDCSRRYPESTAVQRTPGRKLAERGGHPSLRTQAGACAGQRPDSATGHERGRAVGRAPVRHRVRLDHAAGQSPRLGAGAGAAQLHRAYAGRPGPHRLRDRGRVRVRLDHSTTRPRQLRGLVRHLAARRGREPGCIRLRHRPSLRVVPRTSQSALLGTEPAGGAPQGSHGEAPPAQAQASPSAASPAPDRPEVTAARVSSLGVPFTDACAPPSTARAPLAATSSPGGSYRRAMRRLLTGSVIQRGMRRLGPNAMRTWGPPGITVGRPLSAARSASRDTRSGETKVNFGSRSAK